MTERELLIECIPQITEMALEIRKMTPEYKGRGILHTFFLNAFHQRL